MHADLDELLSEAQRFDLDSHLSGCETCRAESQSLSMLTSRLQSEFHVRWDAQNGPSQQVISNVHARTRRIIMSNRMNFGLKVLAGIAVLLVLGFGLNFVISQLQGHSVTANEAAIPGNKSEIKGQLLAFTSAIENGNLDIYTVRPDGSELTNLTNNPAHDGNPFWSPDGKRIAFESDRAGLTQIFVMDPNGPNVIQLTNGEANHEFKSSNPWSPDGSMLVFTERKTGEEKWMLYVMDTDGQNKTLLTPTPDLYSAVSWSPEGKHIAYVILEPVRDRNMARIHVADVNGNNNTNITNLLPVDEDINSWNYTWTSEGNIRFIAGRVAWENNNGKFAAYEATLDGATLVEITKTSTPLVDWWKGTAFVRGFTGETLTWLRSDGTYSEFKPFENCQMGSERQYNSSFSRRSSTGYILFGAGCPNGDLWLYWANSDGTNIKQILESPINITGGGLNEINWSPDGSSAAITVSTSGITYLYILDIREALRNPIVPSTPISIGGVGSINYNVSWQPIP